MAAGSRKAAMNYPAVLDIRYFQQDYPEAVIQGSGMLDLLVEPLLPYS
jgi:hypothetical protein